MFNRKKIFTILGTVASVTNQITGSFNKAGNATASFISIASGTIAQGMLDRYYKLKEINEAKKGELSQVKELSKLLSLLEGHLVEAEILAEFNKDKANIAKKKISLTNYITSSSIEYSYLIKMTIAIGLLLAGTVINSHEEVDTKTRYIGYAGNSLGILLAVVINLLTLKKDTVEHEETETSTTAIISKFAIYNKLLKQVRCPTAPSQVLELKDGETFWRDQNQLIELRGLLEAQILSLQNSPSHLLSIDSKSNVSYHSNIELLGNENDDEVEDKTPLISSNSFIYK